MIFGNEMMVGARLSFFVVQNVSGRWFFEIYIQGSKYNFLELSLNLNKLRSMDRGGEFQLSKISDPARVGSEQIDQATKSI